ncbi:MAG: hypothetical protein ABI986_04210 [Chloroflexota bacterium]
MKKFALPAALVLIGLLCIGGIAFAIRLISSNVNIPAGSTKTPTLLTTDNNTNAITATATKFTGNYPEPTGKIVFTCQIQGDEVCIMNPDGSGWQQLTDSPLASFNASLSPDGKKVVYVVTDGKNSEIYDLEIAAKKTNQLTDLKKNLGSPEISPDNKYIIFHYRSGNSNTAIWVMNRDGKKPHEFYSSPGKDAHDATWSADGKQILFALGKGENNKLYIMDFAGGDPQLVNNTIDTRGRSDWSGALISFDQGNPFLHNVYVMKTDGNGLQQITAGNNSQGASLSPDGMWIAFTAYIDTSNSSQGLSSCEIYIMHTDGTDIRRLTNNNYCDYQPRWGN